MEIYTFNKDRDKQSDLQDFLNVIRKLNGHEIYCSKKIFEEYFDEVVPSNVLPIDERFVISGEFKNNRYIIDRHLSDKEMSVCVCININEYRSEVDNVDYVAIYNFNIGKNEKISSDDIMNMVYEDKLMLKIDEKYSRESKPKIKKEKSTDKMDYKKKSIYGNGLENIFETPREIARDIEREAPEVGEAQVQREVPQHGRLQ